ncbi:Hypothetical predicted protein, partial [Scomber scombrus]
TQISKTVLKGTVAQLPCPPPHLPQGDVTWSRYMGGQKVILVTIQNGQERIPDKHYGSLADGSLVITNVKINDSMMYLCNGKQIYLQVTTDPNMLVPSARPEDGNVAVTPVNDRPDFGLGPGQDGEAAAEDQQSSDFWKVAVGAVIGAALVILTALMLRFYLKKRTERNTNNNKPVTEVIYEEIETMPPRMDSDVECPYYWASISETPSTSTPPPADNLYSTVNKLRTKECSNQEYVYALAQNPLQKD